MLPDIDSLHLFLRAAELHSLSKAATTMHVAVAAASRRIAQLEHVYGVQLLVRTSRGVALTPAGELLQAHAMRLMESAFDLRAAMAAHRAEKQDLVRLYSNTSAATWFLPADLAAFKRKHPDCQLEVVERHSRSVIESLQNGEADVGVFTAGPATEGLRCLPYRFDRLAAIVPRDHPLTGERVAFEDLLEHELVSLEEASDLAHLIAEKAAALHKPLKLRLHMKSFQSVCRMVKCGLGVGLLPLQALQEITSQLGLRSVPLSDAWAIRPLMLGVRDRGRPRPAVQGLIDHLVVEPAPLDETAGHPLTGASVDPLRRP